MKTRRPRITDVARLAGVSESAVSVVLNNRVGEQVRVSEDTQRKIWNAVRELGYIANPVAQTLAGGRTGIIAVFTFEAIFPIDSRSFYYPFLIGIEEEADRQGYDLLLVTGGNSAHMGKRHIYRQGVNRLQRADGALLLGHGDTTEVQKLLDEQYPFVFVGKRDIPGLSYAAADYRAASAQLTEYLITNGHQRIAFLRSTRDTEASRDREQGVRDALHQHALEPQIKVIEPSDITGELLKGHLDAGYTAFIAEDDVLGRNVLAMGKQLNLSCPEDFSLAVLGNPLNPITDTPNWTTFNIPRQQMGSEAFRLLVSLLALPAEARISPLTTTLLCTFHVGETVRSR